MWTPMKFAAEAPNRCWVADITYLRTWEGWLYLIAVQDIYSRRIVGWSMADHMRTELVTDALQMALAHRRPAKGLIWHTDQGAQFVSLAFGQQARAAHEQRQGEHRADAGEQFLADGPGAHDQVATVMGRGRLAASPSSVPS